MSKINLKSLAFHTLVPLMLSFIVSMLIPDYTNYYETLAKPVEVESYIFPIVWSILYILMGIASYIIDNMINTKKEMLIYYIQLAVNLLWPVFFFWLRLRGFSAILSAILFLLALMTAICFYKKNKVSAYLLIPYLLWLIFATYLSTGIYFLNI